MKKKSLIALLLAGTLLLFWIVSQNFFFSSRQPNVPKSDLIPKITKVENPLSSMSTEKSFTTIDEIALDTFKRNHRETLQILEELKDCFSAATKKEEAFLCTQKLQASNMELSRAFGEANDSPLKISVDDFSWNANIREETMREISNGLVLMRQEQECVDEIVSIQDIGECVGR